MKVLILEDDSNRIRIFTEKLKGHDCYFFTNIKDAKDAVGVFGPFDYYFLDHDLDDLVYVDSNEPNTGYQFAKYLKEINASGEIIVHSMNVVGAQNIKDILPQSQLVPFHMLFEK